MSELMLINPRKRRAKRKMTAKQAKYFAPRKKRRKAGARRAVAASVAAPKRRRRRVTARGTVTRRRRRRSTARRAYRRRSAGGGLSLKSLTNPSALIRQIMPAAIGAGGALAFDVAYAMVPIPATWKAGPLAIVTKLGFILGAGMVASNFGPKKLVGEAVAGALLVTAYDFLKTTIRTAAPSLPLSEYVSGLGYISPATQIAPGMGEYVSEMPVSYNSSPFDMDEVF